MRICSNKTKISFLINEGVMLQILFVVENYKKLAKYSW